MNNESLPKRKRNRLKNYDYSSCDAYFITICTKDRKNLFWKENQQNSVGEDIILPPKETKSKSVGEDIILPPEETKSKSVEEDIILPPEETKSKSVGEDIILPSEETKSKSVGEDIILPPKEIKLTDYGKIVDHAIRSIPDHYNQIELMQYVIMPNHIHLILLIPYDCGRIISSPTSIQIIVGQMKRYVSKKIGEQIWQKSFHDHVIRNKRDYEKITKYIYENPMTWQNDCFYKK